MMNENAQRALITAYFLSRFPESYQLLGYSTKVEGHTAIGSAFGLTAYAIKNRRDEFDPIHGNARVGWNQREMRPSRRKVVEQFEGVSRDALLELIRPWVIQGLEDPQLILDLLPPYAATDDDQQSEPICTTARTITGKKAEDYFIDSYSNDPLPVLGNLVDCRAMGTGYDFRIETKNGLDVFVEVKGLAGSSGQITFTSKEWAVSQEAKDQYFVALVRCVDSNPILTLHRNPAAHLKPKARLISVIQETWTISSGPLMVVGT